MSSSHADYKKHNVFGALLNYHKCNLLCTLILQQEYIINAFFVFP